MSFKDETARFVVAKTIGDAIDDAIKAARAALFSDFCERYVESGTTTVTVDLPGLGKVAKLTLSLNNGGPCVSDRRAFTEWVAAREPSDVELVVRKTSETAILSAAKRVGDKAVDLATGEVIPGVQWTDGGTPSFFSVNYEKGKRAEIIDAIRGQALTSVLNSLELPSASETEGGAA